MGTTITIRNLDEAVKQRLRIQAATHGRAMEAEAREILTRAVMGEHPLSVPPKNGGIRGEENTCAAVRGIWKGRLRTDEVMELTRGE